MSLATGVPQQSREAQLVAAGEKDAAGLEQAFEAPGLVAVPAGIKIHHRHALRADVAEHLLVSRAGLVHAAGGRNDDDVGVLASRDAHKALEDPPVVFLILRSADRNNPSTPLTVGNFAGHRTADSLIDSGGRERYHGRPAGSS